MGHHNRVLSVTRDGEVSEVIAFGNIVPTGLQVFEGSTFLFEVWTAQTKLPIPSAWIGREGAQAAQGGLLPLVRLPGIGNRQECAPRPGHEPASPDRARHLRRPVARGVNDLRDELDRSRANPC